MIVIIIKIVFTLSIKLISLLILDKRRERREFLRFPTLFFIVLDNIHLCFDQQLSIAIEVWLFDIHCVMLLIYTYNYT